MLLGTPAEEACLLRPSARGEYVGCLPGTSRDNRLSNVRGECDAEQVRERQEREAVRGP
jgi:hypothetical protein